MEEKTCNPLLNAQKLVTLFSMDENFITHVCLDEA
jgi:hypothetical protein